MLDEKKFEEKLSMAIAYKERLKSMKDCLVSGQKLKENFGFRKCGYH